MPFRRSKRRKRRGRPSVNTVKSPSEVMPDLLKVKLTYKEVLNHNFGALQGSYIFNANSLFDPNRTGIGHQPLGFDQLKTMYNRYKVTGLQYKITVAGCNTPVSWGTAPMNGSAGPSTLKQLEEQPYAKSKIVSSVGGDDISIISGYISMKRLLGRKQLTREEEAVVSGSPAEIAILATHYNSLDGVTNMTNITTKYELVYYCEFFDRLLLGQS